MERLIENIKNNKKSIIYFYSKSCRHCKELKPKINILEAKNKENYFSINIYEDEKISDSFKIEYVPTLVIVENKKITKLEGYEEIEKFYETVIDPISNTKRNL